MAGGRISQVLPSVKCSNCNFPVPLDELSGHVCSNPPPVPTLPKPIISPGSAVSLLPTRLQNLVSPTLRSFPSQPKPPPDTPRRLQDQSRTDKAHSDRSRTPLAQAASATFPRPDSQRTPDRARTPPAAPREPFLPRVNPSPLRNGSPGPAPTGTRTARPSENVAHPSPLQHATYAPPRETDIDTKIGGEAGMAGVGRRGFAAAARAAMIVGPSGAKGYDSGNIPGMDGRRANAPAYLNISSLHPTTPPLSPNSHSSPSHSPSPHSRSPSPSIRYMPSNPDTPTGSAPSTPRLPFFEKYKNKLPAAITPTVTPSPLTRTRTPQPESKTQPLQSAVHLRSRSNGSNRFARPPSPSSDSEHGLAYADSTGSEAEDQPRKLPPLPQVRGLALGAKKVPPLSDRSTEQSSKLSRSASERSSGNGGVYSDKHGSASIARALGLAQVPVQGQGRYSGGPGGPEVTRERSASSASIYSANRRDRSASPSASVYSKSTGTGTGTGGLERAMGTLLEDIASSSSLPGSVSVGLAKSKSSSSAASTSSNALVGAVASYRSKTVRSPETKAPKLPSRSHTSPTAGRDSGGGSKKVGVEKRASAERAREKRKRRCVKCRKDIDNGRWVQMDEGSVLCEKCWKNMYLPKCRRCDLPIENQAVSSSDGQLKGKYHRACFNCHTCHKPFPDKTFYVFDGKPLCAYHYHESNNSLCTAARCGQPIEGPCAVSHSGDRYHPEHFLCEYAGYRPCHERLVEYWEVDGMMLCERHANKEMTADADLEESPMPSARAMKRKTRFIDLAGGGAGGGGSNAF